MFFKKNPIESLTYQMVKKSEQDMSSFANDCEISTLIDMRKFIEKKLIPIHDKHFKKIEEFMMKQLALSSRNEAKNVLINIAKDGNLNCLTANLGALDVFGKKGIILRIDSSPSHREALINASKKYASAFEEYQKITKLSLIIKTTSDQRIPAANEHKHHRHGCF